jgi:hypothetical protein
VATLNGKATIKQTANDVRLSGFGIANLDDHDYNTAGDTYALLIACTSNTRSIYDTMYFWLKYSVAGNNMRRCPVYSTVDLGGTWRDCTSGAFSFWVAANKTLRAAMYNCLAGPYSFNGEAGASITGQLVRCSATGITTYASALPGTNSFGGGLAGCDISGTLIDCIAGPFSYALGRTFSGKAIRCRGGTASFASGIGSNEVTGVFSGYAEDCVGGAGSFAGGHYSMSASKITGKLVRCVVGGKTETNWRLQGAYLDSCIFQADDNGSFSDPNPCLVLLDNNCVIYNTVAISGPQDYGDAFAIASNAAGRTAKIAHCRLSAPGIDTQITNTIGTPYNVIDADLTAPTIAYP